MRRYFGEAIPTTPSKDGKPSDGEIERNYCNQLFEIEKQLENLTPSKIKNECLKLEKSVLEAFLCWINLLQSLNGSRLGKAVTYEKTKEIYGDLLARWEIFTLK